MKLFYKNTEVEITEEHDNGTVNLQTVDGERAFKASSGLRHHRGQSFRSSCVLYVNKRDITFTADNLLKFKRSKS